MAKGITNEAFVMAWQRSRTAAAAAEKLGVSRATLYVRAARLRRLGVKLKKHESSYASYPVDVQKLNKLCK